MMLTTLLSFEWPFFFFQTKTFNLTAFVSLALSSLHLSYSAFLSVSWKQPHSGSTAVTLFIMCFFTYYILSVECSYFMSLFSSSHKNLFLMWSLPCCTLSSFPILLSYRTLLLDIGHVSLYIFFHVSGRPCFVCLLEVWSSTVCTYHGTPRL